MNDEEQVGTALRLRFDDIAPKGDAVASSGASKPVFAAGVIPGEEAVCRVRRMHRNWIAVDVEEIVEPSPHRVEPRCPLFTTCSGCQLQHVDYAHQLELKHRMVTAQLERFGGFVDPPVLPVLGMEDPWYYRNHARFTVKQSRLGFIRRYKRQWFEVPHCMIMEPEINRILEQLQGRIDTTQCNVRVGASAASIIVQPRLPEDLPVRSGQTHLEEELFGRRFRVSAAAFFQVNRVQAERLVDVVRDRVGAGEIVVADAYAGVGTFAVLLADRVSRIIAIEESAQAVADARVNAAGLANVDLRHGRAEDVLAELQGQVDVVILDPPRSGCMPSALEAVCRLAPRRVVYVSCDPASLGRDLGFMCGDDGGFRLRDVQPIDMFPHTHHVETVTTLDR